MNYNPMATRMVMKGGVFFTPLGIAEELATASHPKGDVIDLCAGIGVLSHALIKWDNSGYRREPGLHGDIKRIVCVDNDFESVEIGRKLVPEAEWYCHDVFDWEFMESLGEFLLAISNPPYGNIPSAKNAKWTKVRGPAQWRVIELALRMAYNGGYFVLPSSHSDYDMEKNEYKKGSSNYREKYLGRHWPDVRMNPYSSDLIPFEDDPESIQAYDWKGVDFIPNLIDISVDGVDWPLRPFGFSDVKLKFENRERKKKRKQVREEAEQAQVSMF